MSGNVTRPGPFELWRQAGGDGARYRELMREHGHLLGPGDEGYEDASRNLPCGWPGRRGTVDAYDPCVDCGGSGYHADGEPCATCFGSGQLPAGSPAA